MPFSEYDLMLEQWKMAAAQHRHLDSIIWQHFNYFVTINLALFPLIAVVLSLLSVELHLALFIAGLLCAFGMYISYIWRRVQARQRIYQRLWIENAKKSEEGLKVETVRGREKVRVLTLYQYPPDHRDQKLIPAEDIRPEARGPIMELIDQLAKTMARAWAIIGGIFFGVLLYLIICLRM